MANCKRKPIKGIDAKLFATAKLSGASTQVAMQAAGYAPTTARRGWDSVGGECKAEYAKQLNITLNELDKVGGQLTPAQRAREIRGKALRNIAEGKDESVGSMKLLGSDKELAMFQPDNMTGIIVIQMPANLPPLPARIEGIAPPRADLPPYTGDGELLDRGAKAGGQA